MKVGLGLYRHMLTPDYYAFARQAGCTHVVVHLVDYFRAGSTNPRGNQPTGAKYETWGHAGDPEKLWTSPELKALRKELEDADLTLAAIENLDPACWHDILLDGPLRPQQIEKVKTIIRNFGEAGIPVRTLQLNDVLSMVGIPSRQAAFRIGVPFSLFEKAEKAVAEAFGEVSDEQSFGKFLTAGELE